MLELSPITLREARAFVAAHHRHHRAPQGGVFAVAVSDGTRVRGVAIVGRPVARRAQDTWTAEVTRVATDGARNACSMLLGASWRAARAMGYRCLLTYTLATEDGASLRAAGWTEMHRVAGGRWSREARPRVDDHPLIDKVCWARSAA